jgi:DNA helicase TIP49 (TBP-interacting protein)
MGGTVLGRDEILGTVEALALSGETVLVYGPLGIGKTAILVGQSKPDGPVPPARAPSGCRTLPRCWRAATR